MKAGCPNCKQRRTKFHWPWDIRQVPPGVITQSPTNAPNCAFFLHPHPICQWRHWRGRSGVLRHRGKRCTVCVGHAQQASGMVLPAHRIPTHSRQEMPADPVYPRPFARPDSHYKRKRLTGPACQAHVGRCLPISRCCSVPPVKVRPTKDSTPPSGAPARHRPVD